MDRRLRPAKLHAQIEKLSGPRAQFVKEWTALTPLHQKRRPLLICPDGMHARSRDPATPGSPERDQLALQRGCLPRTKHPQRILPPTALQMPNGGVESTGGPFHSRKSRDVEHQQEMLTAARHVT